MYGFTMTAHILEGMSNAYVFSTVTLFITILVALYWADFFKDDNEFLEDDENWDDLDEPVLQSYEVRQALKKKEEEQMKLAEAALQGRKYIDCECPCTCGLEPPTGAQLTTNCTNSDEGSAGDADDSDEIPSNDGLRHRVGYTRLRELESQLTNDQLEEERRAESYQLAAIFELLKKQETELNLKEIDQDELTEQLNLYR